MTERRRRPPTSAENTLDDARRLAFILAALLILSMTLNVGQGVALWWTATN